jgi:1,4-dihydroxy-6-naphthoate synthase
MPAGSTITLRLGHSPDPDDAFMWWPLTPRGSGAAPLRTPGLRFEPVLADIESLNGRSEHGDLDITAVSAAQYPFIADRYAITACGASFGVNYGPKLVARPGATLARLRDLDTSIAVAGRRTSSALTAALALHRPLDSMTSVPFEEIIERTRTGEFDAGVVIHEGQLTYASAGLNLLLDLGEWWFDRTRLPLPLGLNVIRCDLDDRVPGGLAAVTRVLTEAIQYALAHRDEAVEFAQGFGRGIDRDVADRFIEMYVNPLAVDMGETGAEAIWRLIEEGAAAGLCPAVRRVPVVRPA